MELAGGTHGISTTPAGIQERLLSRGTGNERRNPDAGKDPGGAIVFSFDYGMRRARRCCCRVQIQDIQEISKENSC